MKHNKQHDIRAASLKRIAKMFRKVAKDHGFSKKSFILDLAKGFDAEAKLLRSMR